MPFRTPVPLARVLRLVRTRSVQALVLDYVGDRASALAVWTDMLAAMRLVAPCTELPPMRLELRVIPSSVVATFFETLLPRQLTGLAVTVCGTGRPVKALWPPGG